MNCPHCKAVLPEAVALDAARYRWIRDRAGFVSFGGSFYDHDGPLVNSDGLDKLVDGKIAEETSPPMNKEQV